MSETNIFTGSVKTKYHKGEEQEFIYPIIKDEEEGACEGCRDLVDTSKNSWEKICMLIPGINNMECQRGYTASEIERMRKEIHEQTLSKG